ncbi:MAG: hypothetical protein ACTSW2_02075 [Alphaproteobacteria bacterium]
MRPTVKRFFVILATLTVLGGCAAYSLVDAKRQTIGGAYSVEPSIQWSKIKDGEVEVWTIDGASLEAIRFYSGMEAGDQLFTVSKDAKMPAYDPAMKASEVMEFVVDSIARGGAGNVEGTALRPAQFAAASGFRFDLSYTSSNGLWFDGMAVGFIIDGKLNLIIYAGTRQYYFPKYRDEVERMIGTIETI